MNLISPSYIEEDDAQKLAVSATSQKVISKLPGSDFLSDVHFLNLVDFLKVRIVHCACANDA